MVSMIMSLMIMPLMIMSLMRMTMIIQFLPMNVFNTFYIITDFYDHGYIFILACDRVCDLGHDRVCGRVYDHVYGHDHVNSFVIMFWLSIINWRFSFTYPPYTTTLIWCLCIDWLYPYFYGNVLHIDYLLSIKYLRISFKSTYYHFDYDVLQDTLLHKVKP